MTQPEKFIFQKDENPEATKSSIGGNISKNHADKLTYYTVLCVD